MPQSTDQQKADNYVYSVYCAAFAAKLSGAAIEYRDPTAGTTRKSVALALGGLDAMASTPKLHPKSDVLKKIAELYGDLAGD